MTGHEMLRVLGALRPANIQVWLDGGWAVDAALGEQTRRHADLDLVGLLTDFDSAVAALAPLGYAPAQDERPVRYVLRAAAGCVIDVHTVTSDAEGGGLQPQPDGSTFRYPPEGFGGPARSPAVASPASAQKSSYSATSATSRTKTTATTCGCSALASG